MENKIKKSENRMGFNPGSGRDTNIFAYPVPAFDYVIYVDDLSWLEDHQERLQTIRMASPEDTIRLVVNSPGGLISVASAYTNAIAESAAEVVTHAEGNVCSAGTMLWLSAKERTVSPLTIFMFHNVQSGVGGDVANITAYAEFQHKWSNRLMDHYYKDVLTAEELTKIKNAGEVWMDELEILKRTRAILLDEENIRRMQSGKSPKMIPLEKEGATEEEEKKRVCLRVVVGDKDVTLDAENLTEETLSSFSTPEIVEILEQVVELLDLPAVELPADNDRQEIIHQLSSFGKKIREKLEK